MTHAHHAESRVSRRGYIRVYAIPLLAIAGVSFAVYSVVSGSRPPEAQPPLEEPPRASYASFVAGSGLVEPASQNIAVGAHSPGVVTRVAVKAGDVVSAGDVLFTIDDRDAMAAVASAAATVELRRASLAVREAQAGVREADVEVAEREVARLAALPREESVPPARARVAQARAAADDARAQLERWEAVGDERAVSRDTITQRRFAADAARATLDQAEADLALLMAGAFGPDVEQARARVDSARAAARAARAEAEAARAEVGAAEAMLNAARVEVDRRTVRAPMGATVLQVNTRPGEFAPAGPMSTPLVVLGVTTPLVVRTDIDEHEAWRVVPGSPAEAFLRGNPRFKASLRFLRFEPYIIPKRSLTGDSTERVDTRVLQVLFTLDRVDFPVYVGQQMDVYIEAPRRDAPRPFADPSPPIVPESR
ncbi:MAG: biotin/lipoyl-binding protein [Phycisphaeraceae bacterium]|nr:MAG: biotin/lipoyl-binding protein [Phycisphaeraceae bacterium]